MTEYPYRPKWLNILASMAGLMMALWLAREAWRTSSLLLGSIAAILTLTFRTDFVLMIVYRFVFPQHLGIGPASWSVPSGLWSWSNTEIPLAEIQTFARGAWRGRRYLKLRYADRSYTLYADMLPRSVDIDALLLLLVRTANPTALGHFVRRETGELNFGAANFPVAVGILIVGWALIAMAAVVVGFSLFTFVPFGLVLVAIVIFLVPGLVLRAIAVHNLDQQKARNDPD